MFKGLCDISSLGVDCQSPYRLLVSCVMSASQPLDVLALRGVHIAKGTVGSLELEKLNPNRVKALTEPASKVNA